jgi:RimJ/RimL family protein N-acetyltransferase
VIAAGIVTLRPWQPSDASFVYFACQDDDVRRCARLPLPFRAGHVAAFVSCHARPQPEESGAFFAITRTDSGELLGSISLSTIDRAGGRAMAAYWLAGEARGEGMATAALGALVSWAFAELGLAEVRLAVDIDNDAGVGVARRAGFVPLESADPAEQCFRRTAAP